MRAHVHVHGLHNLGNGPTEPAKDEALQTYRNYGFVHSSPSHAVVGCRQRRSLVGASFPLDEIFPLKLTSYLSPKAIFLFSFGLGHHFWSSVPFGITDLTDFIIKSFHSLKYPKKLCLDQGGIYCCLLI